MRLREHAASLHLIGTKVFFIRVIRGSALLVMVSRLPVSDGS
jgi:hypothetical protein